MKSRKPTTATPVQTPEAERLQQVLRLAEQNASSDERATLSTFAGVYFSQADPEDIEARSIEDLTGALRSHFEFFQQRAPGKPKVRVFNPNPRDSGFSSRHTIIEIVNDDMPFLVDSVTMEVNRHGLTLHLIIHPLIGVKRDAQGLYQLSDGKPGMRRAIQRYFAERQEDATL